VGDAESGPIRLSFNPQLRVEFRGATVTSDAGLLLPRELDFRTAEEARGVSRGLFSNARERGLGSKSQIPVHFVLRPDEAQIARHTVRDLIIVLEVLKNDLFRGPRDSCQSRAT
jgi:hypothetical protein